jgi:alkylmercury lyase
MEEVQRILELIKTEKTTDEQAVCGAAFHAILNGQAIDPAGLAAALGFPAAKVDLLLENLIDRGMAVIDPDSGRVLASWGLSVTPTAHRLRIRGRELYAWCALDAIGIPAGLDENATIGSACHQCEAPVSVEMTAGQVIHTEPIDVQLWLTAGELGRSVVGFT